MEKFSDDQIRQSIDGTIIETFDTMMELKLESLKQAPDQGLDDEHLVGAVCFAGEVVGVMSIQINRNFSHVITAAMLGVEASEIGDEDQVKDVVGELCNIIAGNLKTEMMDSGLSCVISTPSITSGTDFKIDLATGVVPLQFYYQHDGQHVVVEVRVKEEIGTTEHISKSAELSSDDLLKMMNSVDVRTTVINSVIDVYYTMLSMEIEHIPQVPAAFTEERRTVGSVSFAGDVNGIFNIQVNDDFAAMMTAAMLGMAVDEIESQEDVHDVIREMSNMIGGNLKSAFVDAGLSCVLSTPSITNGLDFRVEPVTQIVPERFLFTYQDHTIIVEAGIKKLGAAAGDMDIEAQESSSAAQPAATALAAEAGNNDSFKNLDLILDIPLEVTVELGRTKKKINDLLRIGEGSVVELSQLEGEPVDILVNRTLIARGVVVVEKERYGIRISHIVSRKERIKSLR